MPVFNAAGLELLQSLEALKLEAYADEGGVWTIGWGHTGAEVMPGLHWTKEHADLVLAEEIQHYAKNVLRLLPNPELLNDNQFSALVIFAYNIGIEKFAASSALGKVLKLQFKAVPDRMKLYHWVHDRITKELKDSKNLRTRRLREIALWEKPPSAPKPMV
jgi:lysozyme